MPQRYNANLIYAILGVIIIECFQLFNTFEITNSKNLAGSKQTNYCKSKKNDERPH